MSEKLSVAIIARNASGHIADCLDSVRWADEIVLLDGHSTDRTREIAASFGARIFEKDFESFPIERQYIADRCANDWILSLDADMIVPPGLAGEIRSVLADTPGYDGYVMRCLNHFLGREIRHCSWFDYRFLRLFNRKKGAYKLSDRVLDTFRIEGRTGKLKNYLVHHQAESLEEYLQKMTRMFAPLTADEYIAKGVRVRWWNTPWYFCVRPALVFFYKYFCRFGFLDGVPGLIICVNSAILYYHVFCIVWDRQKGRPDYRLERYLPSNEGRKP